MTWIVLGEENGKIKLVSKKPNLGEVPGLLPKGSFLTIESDISDAKFILRVDSSTQFEPFKPSPLVVDMDLNSLFADRKCQNVIHAYRIKEITSRIDGKIDFIHPQTLARRSNQKEVDLALSINSDSGPSVFPATIHAGQNQLLVDDDLNLITAKLPEEMFFYQMQVCGKTGSGKTVATKFLAQYFVEKLEGAVLAINVKDTDFLKMNFPSVAPTKAVEDEWNRLDVKPHGVDNFTVFYPANSNINNVRGIDHSLTEAVTLDVLSIEPESMTGILQNISDIGAQSFPDIFRYWQEEHKETGATFMDFIEHFQAHGEERIFPTRNVRGDDSEVPLHRGTYNNVIRNLNAVIEFFDNSEAKVLSAKDILYPGQFSVINVTGQQGPQFGAILLRHLLKQIVDAKSSGENDVPVLVIIDEVHQFYNSDASREALGVLDTICRTGRSQKIGVIFSSQNQEDLPRGLSSVINSKIFFKSDLSGRNSFGVSSDEIQSLGKGFAVANIHELPALKVLKFPLALAGVID